MDNINTLDFVKQVHNKEIDVVEHTAKVLEEAKKIDREYHYFTTISEELAMKQAEALKKKPFGRLAGVVITVKDAICVKDVLTQASSKILEGYKPFFNATAIELAVREGAIVIGKTVQDEFGFGGFSTNVGKGFQIPLNPFDKTRSCGGSSGGAGGITQLLKAPHIAIGESTGGSIESPASFCGVFGLCPSYGLVSRYGLLDYANSLDKIGPLSRNAADLALMTHVVAKHDPKDSTSLKVNSDFSYDEFLSRSLKGKKIGILKEAFGEGTNKNVEKECWKALEYFTSHGASFEEISLPITMKYGIPAYYLIATTEASTNLAKYCGIRYGASKDLKGSFNEYFSSVRSENFGKEAKRRIMLGTFARMSGFRDAYYIKAASVRTKIINEYKSVFKKFDVIASPSMPILPPKFEDIARLTPFENYKLDILTVGPNLAGMPHINIPVGFSGHLPVGLMLTSDHLCEGKLLEFAGKVVLK